MVATVLMVVLSITLFVHILLMAVSLWRVWRGENIIDRLVGADMLATITLAVVVILALITRNSIYIDVALGLAVLSFVSTIAFARYFADEQVF